MIGKLATLAAMWYGANKIGLIGKRDKEKKGKTRSEIGEEAAKKYGSKRLREYYERRRKENEKFKEEFRKRGIE